MVMLNVLITGGSGYFGSVLTKQLLDQGYLCTIFDLNPPDFTHPNLKYRHGDICNPKDIQTACQSNSIVLHNIAQVPVVKDEAAFNKVNIQGTVHLFDACLKHNVKKIIYTSSSAVYGVPKQNPVFETSPPKPQEPYGKSKWEAEKICHRYRNSKGLDITIIRPRTILGHGRLGIFQILFEWIYQGHNIPILDGGKNSYQFIHAEDLAKACILAFQKNSGPLYNIGTNQFGSMRSALENLIEYAQSQSQLIDIPLGIGEFGMKLLSKTNLSPLSPYHTLMYGRSLYFDISKAQNDLNWHPRFSNNKMFQESYLNYIQERETILSKTTGSPHQNALPEESLKWIKLFI